MISLSHRLKLFVCCQPTDIRRSFDRLCGQAQQVLEQDPLSGNLFVFRNRNRDRLKILYWDRDGLAIWIRAIRAIRGQYSANAFQTTQLISVVPSDVRRAMRLPGRLMVVGGLVEVAIGVPRTNSASSDQRW